MAELISLSPQKAFKLLKNDSSAILVDVRSSMEYLFVGHPVGAIHIAWIDDPDWEVNPDFVIEVSSASEKKSPNNSKKSTVVLICRSGVRTKDAAKVLLDAGFGSVVHVKEGFEGERDNKFQRSTVGGWRYHGLPWEQC